MRAPRLFWFVVSAVVAITQLASAQPLAIALFERYLLSLRQQAGIPGLSAAIVQGRRIVWETAVGLRDVEAALPTTPDTPFPIGDLSQTFAAVLVQQCAERNLLSLADPIRRWSPSFPNPSATLYQVLSHGSDPTARGGFKYDPSRFVSLTAVAEQCTQMSYRRAVAEGILNRLAMTSSVPGRDASEETTALRLGFEADDATRYTAIEARMAAPYRVDRGGRATKSEVPVRGLDAAIGLIASVRDLARFDVALDDQILLSRETLDVAWQNARSSAAVSLPTGLGWFVQSYNGERLVWHFSLVPDAYSSLWLKIPGRDLTLILLANSDGLSSSFSLADGDVTASLFARTFLRLFL